MRFDRRVWVRLSGWLRGWLALRLGPASTPSAVHDLAHQQEQALVRAVDAGGLPLHPARVNQIARQLGLEVSSAAPVGETVARIRAALARLG